MKAVIDLEELSEGTKVRIAVETTDRKLLEILAKDEKISVRAATAYNLNISHDTRRELSEDKNSIVRFVAEHTFKVF